MIDNEHRKEWVDSAVHFSLIDLNVKSLEANECFEYLFYALDPSERRNDGRLRDYWLKQYNHLYNGGWYCSGYDPLEKKNSDWGCLKPNTPRIDFQRKRTIKYEHPPKAPTQAFFLNISDTLWQSIANANSVEKTGTNFWDWVQQNRQIPLCVTEGAKKAGALLSANQVAIALPGINAGYRTNELDKCLIPQIEIFCQRWREIIFFFDQEKKWKTYQAVILAVKNFGRLLEEKGCEIFICTWNAKDGKGIDDLIANKGVEEFEKIYQSRQPLKSYLEQQNRQIPYSSAFEFMRFVEIEFGERLKYDEMKDSIMLNETTFDLSDEQRFWILEEYSIYTSKDNFRDAITYTARKNSFNSVRDYLEHCEKTSIRVSIDNLADRYFGTSDPLYNTFLRKWLIAAIARSHFPGCQVDNALVLQGLTGAGKSSFFHTLGGEWFDDSLEEISSKDGYLILNKCWIQELAEFDKISSKNHAGKLKAFVTRKDDTFRAPYDRHAKNHPRKFVFCGSVNKFEFLFDDTGNRRFWVIPLAEGLRKINIEQLRKERNGIWASAMDAFRRGDIWHLTNGEEIASEQNNQLFETSDAWQDEIENYIEGLEKVSIAEILERCFDIPIGNQDKLLQNRVASCLLKIGFYKYGRAIHMGKRQTIWKVQDRIKFEVCKGGMADFSGKAEKPCTESDIKKPYPFFRYGCSENESQTQNAISKEHLKNGYGCTENQSEQGLEGNDQKISHTSLANFESDPILNKGKEKYHKPDPPFRRGETVLFEGKYYAVKNSGHTHVELEGLSKSVAVWQCTLVTGVRKDDSK